MLGDSEAQDTLRTNEPNKSHCAWLRRDSNACNALPSGIKGLEDKIVQICPHNVYALKPQVFENRDAVSDTLERLFRLVNSAEVGSIVASELDPFSVTELITAKVELDRQSNDRQKREYERSRMEAQSNQGGRGINFDDPSR